MKPSQKILITLLIGAVLILGFYIVTDLITKITGFSVSEESEEKDFEKCLKEQDIVLYINSENVAQSLKNTQLIDYLEHVDIINCLRNNQVCLEKGVNSFPTWIINENRISRDISLGELSEFSGCRIW